MGRCVSRATKQKGAERGGVIIRDESEASMRGAGGGGGEKIGITLERLKKQEEGAE